MIVLATYKKYAQLKSQPSVYFSGKTPWKFTM